MALNFFKLIILLIPFAWFGQKFAGLTGIFIGITLSFLISGIVSWLVLIKYFKDISDCEK
jgi:Na+-driven multidrug efflux pump